MSAPVCVCVCATRWSTNTIGIKSRGKQERERERERERKGGRNPFRCHSSASSSSVEQSVHYSPKPSLYPPLMGCRPPFSASDGSQGTRPKEYHTKDNQTQAGEWKKAIFFISDKMWSFCVQSAATRHPVTPNVTFLLLLVLLRFANHLSFFIRREAGIAFVHTTILEMLQIPRKLSVEKADKRQET